MAKSFTAKKIARINNIRPAVNKEGIMTAMEVSCEVNYGEFGRVQTVDILPLLGNADQANAQVMLNRTKAGLEAYFLT